jgi:hypothetical protein
MTLAHAAALLTPERATRPECQDERRADEHDVEQPPHPYHRYVHAIRLVHVVANLTVADAEDTAPPPPDQMFSTTISIRGFQKFLTSHYVSGVAIACELDRRATLTDRHL